jgi:type I restriction enzyme, R subunit
MSWELGNDPESPELKYSEIPALEQLVSLGYEYKGRTELNKEKKRDTEVLLYGRLRNAIKKINPNLDEKGIDDAVSQIHEDNYPFSSNLMETNEKIRAKLIGLSKTGGLEPITVEQMTRNGLEPITVELFDFENIENNDFLVTNQFELHGFKTTIKPDIILFVNGIPLVIIECKKPFARWLEEAVELKNFKKYRSPNSGYERLMFYNHFLVAMCGIEARHGTLSSNVNHFKNSRWSSIFSHETNETKPAVGNEQHTLIEGMLNHQTLLDLLKHYVIYKKDDGKVIKIIAKHQQYRAVEKSITKIKNTTSMYGGVIWHTQGSGKSFTMRWLAEQAMSLGNLPIVIVTDRKQLDKQIYDNFKDAGYPDPERIKHSDKLSEFIQNPKGRTIMTTIQKFGEITDVTKERIVVLVDEAHRSNFGEDAGAMAHSLDNGIFFAFTGTPIVKTEEISTYKTFGNMVDRYGFEESKADGATIPILYVGKRPDLFVEGGKSIDEIFEMTIGSEPEMTPDLKERIKKEHIRQTKIAQSPERIKKIVIDIKKHFEENVGINGYKAMIVAPSRNAAVLYHEEFTRLHGPTTKLIMHQDKEESGKNDSSWSDYYLTDTQKRKAEKEFKKKDNPIKILIVVDMLLVGFDAPIVQTLYLDKPIKEHTLLQAIARVNRPYDEHKTEGLIVDYYGITKNIQKALEIFDENEIKGAIEDGDHRLLILKEKHREVMGFFEGIDITDEQQVLGAFVSSDKRDQFDEALKEFANILNSQMYKKESVEYVDDWKSLFDAKEWLKTGYESRPDSTRPYATRVQQIIDDAIRAKGITTEVKSMEVTFENFLAYVGKMSSPRVRTALIKNKAEQVIKENFHHNPAYYEKIWQILKQLIADEAERIKNDAQYFDPNYENKYREIYEQTLAIEDERKKLGFDLPVEFSIYEQLEAELKNPQKSKDMTKALSEKLLPETHIVEWYENRGVRRRMEAMIYETLEKFEIPDKEIPPLSDKILLLLNKENL